MKIEKPGVGRPLLGPAKITFVGKFKPLLFVDYTLILDHTFNPFAWVKYNQETRGPHNFKPVNIGS